jgi:hypothetical protein
MNSLIAMIIGAVLIAGGAGVVGFFLGKANGYRNGYSDGFDEGQEKIHQIVRRMTCYPEPGTPVVQYEIQLKKSV